MRRYIHTFNMTVVSLLLFSFAVTTSTLRAQDSSAAAVGNVPASSTLSISGHVISNNKVPLANAAIVLVSAVDPEQQLFGEFNSDRPLIQTTTDAEGRYRLSFDAADRRIRTSGDLVLHAGMEGHTPEIRSVPMARIQVGVPLNFELQKATSVSLAVQSASGDPLQNVSVSTASVHGQRIPWAVARLMPQNQTNQQGVVLLKDADAASLDGVFVVGEQFGHQRLAVRRNSDGTAYVQAMQTSSIDGQITSTGLSSIPGISDVRMLVVCVPPYQSNYFVQPLQCSWDLAAISDEGSFRIPSLALGQLSYLISCPTEFPFRESQPSKLPEFSSADSPTQWDIEFTKQVRLTAKIVDASTDRPLANIHINSWDGRLESTFTDENGEAVFYRMMNHVSYYPRDTLGEFFFPDAFYRDSKKVPVNDEIRLETIRLVRSSNWQGTVVDAAGSPVAGAKVTYDFALERFNQSLTCFSDSEGKFRLTGIADKTAAKIRATHGDLAAEPVSIVVPTEEQFVLQLSPVPVASPMGRVIDLDGKPVAGVSVLLKKGVVSQEEKYGPEDLMAKELYDDPRAVRTNGEGRFEFPSTIDFHQPLRIEIRDADFFPFVSKYKVDASEETGGRSVQLGDFQIMRRPASRAVDVLVRSADGSAISDAEVVVVGARVGTIRGVTDKTGRLTINVPNSPAILAVSAATHHIHLSELPVSDASVQIELRAAGQLSKGDDKSVRNIPQASFAAAATTIFQQLPKPNPKAVTFHQLRTYCNALASHDPDQFLQFIKMNAIFTPSLLEVALYTSEQALMQKPELIEDALAFNLVPAGHLAGLLITAANATDDPDLQAEWLAEALVATRSQAGSERMFGTSRLAMVLLHSGRVELAKDIVTELWSEAADLQAIIDSGSRKVMVGESRTIAPMLAMIDLEQSKSLIQLTGREIEIPGLLQQASLIFSQANPDESALEASDATPLDTAGVETWLRSQVTYSRLAVNCVPHPEHLAARMTTPKTRLQFLLLESQRTTDAALQRKLLQLAVDAVRESRMAVDADHHLFHINSVLVPELRRFKNLDAVIRDQLIFNMLWNLPEVFETDRLHTLLGTAAQVVAFKDKHLARTLLEPAMQDRGWLYMGRAFSLSRDETLMSVASIDPDWAVEIVRELCEAELSDDPVDQLELRAGLVQRLGLMKLLWSR